MNECMVVMMSSGAGKKKKKNDVGESGKKYS